MVDEQPANARGRGCAMLMLAVLLLLGAVLAGWAWLDSPPDAPQPEATAAPPTIPGSEVPADR
ncbi:MAG TPA: hypothetical protein VGW34_04940 [Allosphingosinicella sp.]|nr:hypothetical protein [Allosphingosinicella sp.]